MAIPTRSWSGAFSADGAFSGDLLDQKSKSPQWWGVGVGGCGLPNDWCISLSPQDQHYLYQNLSIFQEIPFGHIWSGNQNNLHCSFSLEMVDRVQDSINCKIQVYQKAILSNRQVLKILTDFKEVCLI